MGDSIFKKYQEYQKDKDIYLSNELREFFERYDKKKKSGFTFMEYREFEGLLKHDK